MQQMYIQGFNQSASPFQGQPTYQKDDFTLNDLYSTQKASSPMKLEQVLNNQNSDRDTNDSENAFGGEFDNNVITQAPPKLSKVKTQLCQYYLAGYCQKGDNCAFAHGHEQLKAAPKYKKCMYGRRYCKFGSACRFLHEDEIEELEKTNQMYKLQSMQSHQMQKMQSQNQSALPKVHDTILQSPLKSAHNEKPKSVEDLGLESESDVSYQPEENDGTYKSFGDFLSAYSMRVWGYTEPHNEYPWTYVEGRD